MKTDSSGSRSPHATPGYQGAVYEVPLKACCGDVLAGEECNCADGAWPEFPPILLDLRTKAAAT